MGETYTFQTTNAGAATLGYFTGFQFTVAENDLPAIPLPAAGWLLLTALGGLGIMRRSRPV